MNTSGANGLSRYRRRTASEWQELIARFERTSQPRKAFCVSQGVSLSTFDLWRRKLRGRTAEHRESMFVEVTPVEPNAVSSWDVELELGGGVILRVRNARSC